MDDLEYLVELHKGARRQGPGGEAETARAIELAGLSPSAALNVADIGCGTGAATLQLARSLNASITAVDFLPEFIEVLERRAENEKLGHKIRTLAASMEKLPFADSEYDVIWSEGAIYNIGFARGVREWKRYLKPGGTLVVSEITWTTGSRPEELEQYWKSAYPEIDTASAKLSLLETSGYHPLAYFVLPRHCWLDNYYRPLQARFPGFLEQHAQDEKARSIVAAEKEEIALYEKYHAFYSYGVYIARKIAL